MYRPVLDAVGGSLGLTALCAAIPLAVLFVMIGVFRASVWKSALTGVVLALLTAVLAYDMPVGQALLSASQGAASGFFPILWIVLNAIWIYNMTVSTGHFDVLRRSFEKVSDDQRIQAMLIAFCFGALLEALAGFGTPVAICSVMLIALGFRPMKAAVVALVANTAPVAFGALGTPVITLANVTGLPIDELASTIGRQTPVIGALIPLALVVIVDGRRGLAQTWPAAVVCGLGFSATQFAVADYFSVELADIIAAFVGAIAVIAFTRVWQPATPLRNVDAEPEVATVGAGTATATAGSEAGTGTTGRKGGGAAHHDEPRGNMPDENTPQLEDTPAEVARAYAPYVVIISIFGLAQIPAVKAFLALPTIVFQWPGLHLLTAAGQPSKTPTFTFNWLGSTGSLLLIAGLITIPIIKVGFPRAVKACVGTYWQLRWAVVTVMLVMALAYVMNASGQTATLGTFVAQAGAAFALLSPIIGWFGTAVTGSDTSSNSLFGVLQVTAAHGAGLSDVLMASANTSGGVLGKMISPQNLVIVAAAVGLSGREGDIFRKVLGWSLGFLALMCLLVWAQSTFLSGMVAV